jgi:hypothetical protein
MGALRNSASPGLKDNGMSKSQKIVQNLINWDDTPKMRKKAERSHSQENQSPEDTYVEPEGTSEQKSESKSEES